jgi:hypothetical protein
LLTVYNLLRVHQPKAVSAVEDDALARLMEQAERENAQVSGDEDESEEE